MLIVFFVSAYDCVNQKSLELRLIQCIMNTCKQLEYMYSESYTCSKEEELRTTPSLVVKLFSLEPSMITIKVKKKRKRLANFLLLSLTSYLFSINCLFALKLSDILINSTKRKIFCLWIVLNLSHQTQHFDSVSFAQIFTALNFPFIKLSLRSF